MNKAIDDIRGQDSAELNVKLAELRKEQFELRFSGSGNEGQATGRARAIRRTIARILTVLGDRERQEASKAGEQN
ncbi:MAG: 50S ribosomal protein L29 [Planctomycetota bacterium]|nr:50S ribosomal protein L29 [Planctomycetota bacterium]MEC8651267.1 50S ribosomal protein L29 [Planctomycetota bacterium]MEC9048695.1 50S ribosomal protein L29 [Planctomycetota bacterium]